MPELPELELLKRALSKYIVGRGIAQVIVDPRRAFIIRYPPMDFAREMAGRTFSAVERQGKFLRFAFEQRPDSMYVHAMLGGRFAFCSRAAPPLPATCLTFQLSGAVDLRFLDTANMARVYLSAKPEEEIPSFAGMGPDALDRALTRKAFAERLRKHSGQLKSLMRNQSFIAGIGNSYSDEILWAAKLNPLRRAGSLDLAERNALYDALRSVLREAVKIARKQYESGKHPLHKQDRSFMSIHRKGQKGYPCPRCGHRVSIIHGHGQETYFCRGCQK